MGEGAKTEVKKSSNSSMHGIVLAIIGILVLIIGVAIVAIKHMPFRGSGLGTVAIVIGVVLLLVGGLRLFYKKP